MWSLRLCHRRKTRLSCEIGANMVSHQDRGAFVDDSERFHHMLLFAVGISRHAGGVFEVELPLLHRWGTFDRIGQSGQTRSNASVFVQKPVNGAGRFRQTQLQLFQGFITIQIVEDGFGTWCAAQAFGRIIPHR